jgi:dihydroorotase-like cyclic amidohydrolase
VKEWTAIPYLFVLGGKMLMQLDLIIKNGNVVFPGKGVEKTDIGIRNGVIVGLYQANEILHATEEIDATGMHIFPGLIDAHEHLGIYNSVEQDFIDTKEHAIGGVTTVVNYDRKAVSYHEFFPTLREIGEKNSYIDFAFSLGIMTDQHIDELEQYVIQHGLTSFKFFRNYERQLNDKFKITNGIDLTSMDLVRILTRMKEISPKLILGVHCENMDINRYLTSDLMGKEENDSLRTWSLTSPGYAEAESLLSTLYLNYKVGGNIYIVHLSSGDSVELLEKVPWLLESGVKVETCPHYLALTEDAQSLHAKVGPPIHSKWDQDRLWDGIHNGTIKTIGTDHVPNALSTKYKQGAGVWDTMFGFPGVGALLPIMLTEGHLKRGISLERIADMTSRQVAESFNLTNKGKIQIGCDADFAIVDLKKEKSIHSNLFHSTSDYSVYEGMNVSGWPVYTISRGEIIVDNGVPVKANGRGKYIFRTI